MPALNILNAQLQSIVSPSGAIGSLINQVSTSLPFLSQGKTGASQTYHYDAQPIVTQANYIPTQQEIDATAAMNKYNMDNWKDPGVKWTNLKQSFYSNGNAQFMGGVATAQYKGEVFELPNAVAQNLLATDSWNQGRSNAVSDYFQGPTPRPEGEAGRYVDYGASKGAMTQWIKDNPAVLQEGPLNPYERAKWEADEAKINYNNLNDNYQSISKVENRDVSGNVINDNFRQQEAAVANAQQQAQMKAQNFESNWASHAGYEKGLRQTLNIFDAPKISPTYSNLQIKETYYPSK